MATPAAAARVCVTDGRTSGQVLVAVATSLTASQAELVAGILGVPFDVRHDAPASMLEKGKQRLLWRHPDYTPLVSALLKAKCGAVAVTVFGESALAVPTTPAHSAPQPTLKVLIVSANAKYGSVQLDGFLRQVRESAKEAGALQRLAFVTVAEAR
eukprot:CAMPEP_0198337890 /NCGR_PEP_ID=MMETSP1450-20131203/31480_1 /TAXON_ID=753684 ORGANISM="Madagascaria erythrocladiodes, Strain CCMP3234" /NCGR_SAMPLE_ID=MMETSP1450 /ASSEMBLY_ACC=CAM_ASM_001115 /LENGTH=155 /DNA_ID=CAMNT_0044042733 /DNA_START=40 /DNA_END=503 /DNA_ORIENTATION=+